MRTRSVFGKLAIPTALISIVFCNCRGFNRPLELTVLGVRKGEGLYEKRLLIDLEKALTPCEDTFVDDIFVHDVRRVNGVGDSDVIAILTDCAVIHYDLESSAITSQINLKPFCHPLRFVDIESDGSLEVFCKRRFSAGFALLDADGRTLWRRNDETPFEVSNFRDLDDDGSLDFCARFEQSLACFDLATGDELWRETGP